MAFLPLLKNTNLDKTTIFWIGRLLIWFCLLLVFIFAIQIEKQKLLLWQENPLTVVEYVKSFFLIIIAIMLGAAVIKLSMHLLGFKVIDNSKLKEIVAVFKNNFALLLFTCLTAGFTEELIFRGYLMPRLQMFFKNKYAAVALSSVVFGALHFGYGTLFQILGPLMIGFIFAIHYQKYRNIKILIFCHFFWDFMSLMVASNIK